MAVKVKVELDDQEARQDLKELESEKHKIKLVRVTDSLLVINII